MSLLSRNNSNEDSHAVLRKVIILCFIHICQICYICCLKDCDYIIIQYQNLYFGMSSSGFSEFCAVIVYKGWQAGGELRKQMIIIFAVPFSVMLLVQRFRPFFDKFLLLNNTLLSLWQWIHWRNHLHSYSKWAALLVTSPSLLCKVQCVFQPPTLSTFPEGPSGKMHATSHHTILYL